MHVCQILLVEASTDREAFSNVASLLSDSPDVAAWSDWHNADFSNVDALNFSNRWTGQVFGDLDEKGKFKDPENNKNFLKYSDDPAMAEQVITDYLEQRMRAIENYKEKAIDLSSYKYDPYAKGYNMDLWETKKLAQLLDDTWTPDTGIYDLENWTANLRNFTERVAKNPEIQYLIPVDFHF
jgi:hypothetical protein